ncbi:MAG: hypothetical protein Q4G50_03895 [Corynebacterium sp.]|nr:hypothetical protein [Corynebacterium sp.]MDO5669125.1 hypothetical protein [Corynebacterium sp.]
MGVEFKFSQEYFEDFDPEKFAEMIKAQAEADNAEEDGVDKQ